MLIIVNNKAVADLVVVFFSCRQQWLRNKSKETVARLLLNWNRSWSTCGEKERAKQANPVLKQLHWLPIEQRNTKNLVSAIRLSLALGWSCLDFSFFLVICDLLVVEYFASPPSKASSMVVGLWFFCWTTQEFSHFTPHRPLFTPWLKRI